MGKVTTKINATVEKFWQRKVNERLAYELTASEYYDLRLEVSESYLKNQLMPPDDKKKIVRDSKFWNWFRSTWHYHNIKLVSEMEKEKSKLLKLSAYRNYQLREFNKQNINQAVLDAVINNS